MGIRAPYRIEFNLLFAALCLLASLLPGAARAQGTTTGPFADVPRGHWAYEVVATLGKEGIFTGYPDGNFSGSRMLVRYEFAVAVQRMLHEVQRKVAAVKLKGVPLTDTATLRQLEALKRLTLEFSTELVMLGADTEQLKRNLAAMLGQAEPWKYPAPDLAAADTETYPGKVSIADPGYVRGYWQAVTEWQRGEVAFYTTEQSGPGYSRSTGLLYQVIPGPSDSIAVRALIAGHNEEVRRRLSKHKAPKTARRVLMWMTQEQLWRPLTPEARTRLEAIDVEIKTPLSGLGDAQGIASAKPLTLNRAQREAVSPDGGTLLRLEEGRTGWTLRITAAGKTHELALPDAHPADPEVSALWRPADEAFLYLRTRKVSAAQTDAVLQLIDLHTGAVLETIQVAERHLQQPRDPFGPRKVHPFIEG
jgi:hypothetical protein